jgi:Restriction endonuclease
MTYCPACNTGFPLDLARCPICKHIRRAEAKRQRKAAAANKHKPHKVSKSRRKRIHDRDGNHCLLCLTAKNLTIDHVVPISAGGSSRDENLQTLCADCNALKGHNAFSFTPAAPGGLRIHRGTRALA